ncbi:MAG: tandem-95 repeat protein, partial [Desulfobulbaceae bacterium]|nr:tandem-95 repeat protein [Desulfobulbaceae bacterium]
GIRRSYDQEVYGFELNSAGTMDAMLQVTAGDAGVSFPIYDARTKHLTNSGQSFGGMLVKLNVGAVGGNQPPVPVADSFPATIDTLLSVPAPGVLGNDTDPEGDPLTAALASPTANGATVLNPDGSFTYTPNAGFTGVDSFTYTVSDGTSVSAPITATLYVNPPNIAPTAVDDTFNGTEGAMVSVPAPGVLTNDTDPEGDALTAALSSGPASGTLTFNTDGSFTFDGPAGTHTFTYVANDGTLDSAPATVTIEINDLPSASDDAYGTEENVDLNVGDPGVLGNDSDANPAGGTLTAALVSTTSQGILTFNPDGSFTYEPGFNFSGTDTFTYQVADDLGATGGPATVTITVNETADTVTITRLRWRNNQTRVRIIATS